MVKVLLTGGSGFLAAHILKLLIEREYEVVTTVRSEEQGDKIIEAYPGIAKERLSYVVVKNVAEDGAMDKAVQSEPGFDYIIHTASPFTAVFDDPVKDMLEPAINGTVGVLKSAKAYAPTVKRVVLTSSFAAMLNPAADIKTYDETAWSGISWDDAVNNPRMAYTASKALAERAAWDFVEQEKPGFDLAAINPPLVFGPIIHSLSGLDKLNTSNQRIRDIVQGKYAESELPPTGLFLWVDVRDASLAHVRALEVPEAGGQRFLVSAGHFSNKHLVDEIAKTHPELKSRLPSQPVDDMPEGIFGFNNMKAVGTLGVGFKPLDESIGDTVSSLVAAGA